MDHRIKTNPEKRLIEMIGSIAVRKILSEIGTIQLRLSLARHVRLLHAYERLTFLITSSKHP